MNFSQKYHPRALYHGNLSPKDVLKLVNQGLFIQQILIEPRAQHCSESFSEPNENTEVDKSCRIPANLRKTWQNEEGKALWAWNQETLGDPQTVCPRAGQFIFAGFFC